MSISERFYGFRLFNFVSKYVCDHGALDQFRYIFASDRITLSNSKSKRFLLSFIILCDCIAAKIHPWLSMTAT